MLSVGSKIAAREVTLDDGSSAVFPIPSHKQIVFFYPKDNTPGCTAEACSLRDSYSTFKEKGYEILGVSVDPVKSHQKFIDNHQLPYRLISDSEKKMVEEFGLWVQKKFMGREYMGTDRKTIVLDAQGIVTHIIDKVDTKNAAEQVLALI
jgi:thioredoxin-dependent peroxiredoxin